VCSTEIRGRIDTYRRRVEPNRYLRTVQLCTTHTTQAAGGSEFDFTAGFPIARRRLDVAFTGPHRNTQGRAWAWLSDPCEGTTGLWADEDYPFVQVYTCHTRAPPHFRTTLGVKLPAWVLASVWIPVLLFAEMRSVDHQRGGMQFAEVRWSGVFPVRKYVTNTQAVTAMSNEGTQPVA